MKPEIVKHSLDDIHRFVWQAVSRPLTKDYSMRKRWIDGRNLDKVATEFVRKNDNQTSFERLEIYNQQYWYRLLDCFEDDFPGLKAILGAKRFHQLAQEYLVTHPSRSYSLRDLGCQLVSFLENRIDLIKPDRNLALELARFEWAQIVAFDGPALPVIEESDLTNSDPASLLLCLQPYITLLELNHALDDYSNALKRFNRDRSEAGKLEHEKKVSIGTAPWPVPEKIHMVVHRHNNSVFFKRVSSPAFAILSSLQEQGMLGNALAKAYSCCEEDGIPIGALPAHVKRWFSSWVRLRWLCPRQEPREIVDT